jgi:hypothetical protein
MLPRTISEKAGGMPGVLSYKLYRGDFQQEICGFAAPDDEV